MLTRTDDIVPRKSTLAASNLWTMSIWETKKFTVIDLESRDWPCCNSLNNGWTSKRETNLSDFYMSPKYDNKKNRLNSSLPVYNQQNHILICIAFKLLFLEWFHGFFFQPKKGLIREITRFKMRRFERNALKYKIGSELKYSWPRPSRISCNICKYLMECWKTKI